MKEMSFDPLVREIERGGDHGSSTSAAPPAEFLRTLDGRATSCSAST